MSLLAGFMLIPQAQAFTTKERVTLSVSASGVDESTTFATSVVTQGAETATTLGFGNGGNTFRDSGAAIKVEVDTNVAGNRVIIYTNNLGAEASPQACVNTATGIDGGGLVGNTDCSQTVPIVWAVQDANADYTFTPNPPQEAFNATGASNGVFITDRAHVATFTSVGSALDNQAMKRCADNVPVANTANDGLYPQFFGGAGQDLDLCDQASSEEIDAAEELSKNIAVVAFGFLEDGGTAPDLATANPADTITVTSPIYLPIGADFRDATAQSYSTNTLTVELVTQ